MATGLYHIKFMSNVKYFFKVLEYFGNWIIFFRSFWIGVGFVLGQL